MTKGITRVEFEEWAISRGYAKDKWGHYRKTVNGKEYRFKVSRIHIRNEVRVTHNFGDSEWVRVYGGYFKDLHINSEGKLVGAR